jgi:nanoRNase/pAp phosphatase (c-di-AMP/oligoRNAs hydrolase)
LADSDKNEKNQQKKKQLLKLEEILKGGKNLLILIHNNPDPDAIASALALSYLVENKYNIETSIAYGGNIGRAENKEMVKKLNIHLKKINRLKFAKYDRIALVDTQPGAKNNSLPSKRKCHIVIDHHPKRFDTPTPFEIIQPEIGATATILTEWLQETGLDIPADLATALSYAISSETQNLAREADTRDIQAYLVVYVKSSIRKLAQIINPKLDQAYFVVLARALYNAFIYKNLLVAHLAEITCAEMVAEMSDFLLRRKMISWVLCTGFYKGNLILSIRSSIPKAKASEFLMKLVPDPKTVGGHDQVAGGYISLLNGAKDLKNMENNLSQAFAQAYGYKDFNWQPLLGDTDLEK